MVEARRDVVVKQLCAELGAACDLELGVNRLYVVFDGMPRDPKRPGDLIVAAGGRPVDSIDGLLAAVDGAGETGTISLSVVRGVEESEVTVSFDVSG